MANSSWYILYVLVHPVCVVLGSQNKHRQSMVAVMVTQREAYHTVFWDTTPYNLIEYHPTSRVNHLPPFSRWGGAQLHIPEHNIHGHRRQNLALTRCHWVYRAPWTEFSNKGIKGMKRWKEKKMKNVWERKSFQPVLMSFIEHVASFSLQSRRCLRYTCFMTPNCVPSAQSVGVININS